jgi:hypothetical protein
LHRGDWFLQAGVVTGAAAGICQLRIGLAQLLKLAGGLLRRQLGGVGVQRLASTTKSLTKTACIHS